MNNLTNCRSIMTVLLVCLFGATSGPVRCQTVNTDTINVDPKAMNKSTLVDAIVFAGPVTGEERVVSVHGSQPVQKFTISNAVGIASSRDLNRNNGGLDFYTPGSPGLPLLLPGSTAQIQMSITVGGNVGIGTTTPKAALEIDRDGLAQIDLNSTTGRNWAVISAGSAEGEDAARNGDFEIYDVAAKKARLWIDGQGNTTVDTLQIAGGGDLAEPFAIDDVHIEPGTVLVIDADRPGELKVSNSPYDRTVAGVVSGAGGIHSAISLEQAADAGTDGHASAHKQVALTGRVYAMADATTAPIWPGDLLTTASTRGHCMKATDSTRAQGAVLGKAMTPLASGQGLVLVLVTLQ